MPIVSSRIVSDQPQADLRRWIRAQFTDHVGVVLERVWMALANDVIALADYVATLESGQVAAEIQQNLGLIYADGPLATPHVVYATTAQNGAAVREAYKTATREQVWALAAFLNTLTNPQLGALFGINGNAAAITALRTRLQAAAAKWSEYLAAVGE